MIKTVRQATPIDAEAIARLLYDSFVEFKTLYTEAGFKATTPGPKEILQRLEEGPIWLARFDDLVVGTISVVPKDSGLHLRSMAVLPGARDQLVGGRLLLEAERFAVESGCRRVFLSTTPFLARAIGFYEDFGFRRIDEGPHDLFGTPLFTMEKWLK
jgi:ribosomal protein S18 acetylase RimI-like enzyme